MKKGPTNALESTFMGLGGPINCQRQDYSISKEGIAFCESLNDKYAEDFIEIVKKANVLFLDYSDRKLTHCINEYAIAMLRGEKS